jgi:hypothetical protein
MTLTIEEQPIHSKPCKAKKQPQSPRPNNKTLFGLWFWDEEGKPNIHLDLIIFRSSSPLADLYSTSTMEHHHFDHSILILNSEVPMTAFSLATTPHCGMKSFAGAQYIGEYGQWRIHYSHQDARKCNTGNRLSSLFQVSSLLNMTST